MNDDLRLVHLFVEQQRLRSGRHPRVWALALWLFVAGVLLIARSFVRS